MRFYSIIVLIIIISVGFSWYFFGETIKEVIFPAPHGVVFKLVSGSIPSSEESGIINGLEQAKPTIVTSKDYYIEIVTAKIASNSAYLVGHNAKRSLEVMDSTGIDVFLGQKTLFGWHFVTPGDPNFCQVFNSVPEVITQSDRDYFIGCK